MYVVRCVVSIPSTPAVPAWPSDRTLLSDEEWQALLWPQESQPASAGGEAGSAPVQDAASDCGRLA